MSEQLLKAQYETMRMQVLGAFLADTGSKVSYTYAYAWYHRMIPMGITHDNELAFDDVADIPTRYIGVTLGAVKQHELAGRLDLLAFRKLALDVSFVPEEHIRPILEFLIMTGHIQLNVIKALEVDLPGGPLKWSFNKADIKLPS